VDEGSGSRTTGIAPTGLPPLSPAGDMPHVVIVGAGFGGLETAVTLGGSPIRVTLIDRRNHHLFVPLLYQVATADLSPADIAEPIRKIVSRHRNIDVVMDEVTGIDAAYRSVLLRDGRPIAYDRLVLATGANYNYFGHDDWARYAPGLKSIEDARTIRTRLLRAFERAEMSDDPSEQASLLTVAIVGAGPTGVEMAGSIAELARHTLARDFRRIDPASTRILLIEAGSRVLPGFPAHLGAYAHAALERKGVTLMLNQAVEGMDAYGVTVGDRYIRASCIIWGAGVAASPAGKWLGADTDRAGRIQVGPDLAVPGHDGIYALGDTALTLDADGQPLPGLAQVAKQQGRHLGRALRANLLEGRPMPPFTFHNRGNTAIVGRNAAVFDFGKRQITGWFAWVLWAIIHVYLLVGFEKRLLVTIQWLWRYVTHERGARIISEMPDSAADGPGATDIWKPAAPAALRPLQRAEAASPDHHPTAGQEAERTDRDRLPTRPGGSRDQA